MIDLKKLKTEYPESFENGSKLRAFLRDMYPSEKARTNVLTAMLNERVADVAARQDVLCANNFKRKISDDYGYKTELVDECYNMFVIAFGYGVPTDSSFKQLTGTKQQSVSSSVKSPSSGILSKDQRPLTGNIRKFEITKGSLVKYGGRKQNVCVPSGVVVVDEKVFYNRKSIRKLTLPKSVTLVKPSAFRNCVNLHTVLIRGVYRLAKYSFANCVSLRDVTLPATLKELGSYTFSGCTSLQKIVIPYGVKFIGHKAFDNCKNLAIYCKAAAKPVGWKDDWCPSYCKVTWGYDDTDIAEPTNTALKITVKNTPKQKSNCKIILKNTSVKAPPKTKITVKSAPDFDVRAGVLVKYNGTYNNILLPSNVTAIGDGAFSNHKTLISVIIPRLVKSIGNNAFAGCPQLKNVVFTSGLIKIGDHAFEGCESIVNITIPRGAREIGKFAFANCCNLTNITLPSSVEKLGQNCFFKCKNLINVALDGAKQIEMGAFKDCERLNNIMLPSNLEYIGSSAFEGCKNLPVIVVPIGVKTVGTYAFKGCKKLLIGCRARTIPLTWHRYWNVDNCHVVWNYKS